MKRLAITLASIGLAASCNAFAAYPANTDPTLVAVPQLPGGFVIGLTGIYMQPSASNGDLEWATLQTTPVTGTLNSNIQQVDPGWSFGGGINVGYIFTGTGNDVNLSYLHLNTSDDENAAITGTLAFPTNVLVPTNSLVPAYQTGSSTAEYTLDQVDLTFGQFINVGCRLVLHPFAGARFANITRDLNSDYTFDSTTLDFFETVDNSSSFSGIGPIAGIDASYYVWNGIGVVGHFDTALLVGGVSNSVDDTVLTTSPGEPGLTTISNANSDRTGRVVPVMDAALGLDYTWLFNNADNSDLTLEVGYKVSTYFNAVDKFNNTATFDAIPTTTTTSDVALSGVYANLTLHL